MKTQYTAGPWNLDLRTDSITTINTPADGGDIICCCPDAPASYDRWKANARLISAGPCMLEALQRIANYLQGIPKGFGPELAINDAQKAINKALGGDTPCS